MIIINCDNCEVQLYMEDWQHRKDNRVYCHDCYKNGYEVKYELTGNDASIMESVKKE